jgi:RHS repeat-associated protein
MIEKSHYYPFGMRFYPESTSNINAIAFRYNGKEYDSMNGLNRYDYGARFYDPSLGGWHTPDPMAGKKPWISPYTYCRNNPLRFIDPDGRDEWDVDLKGHIKWEKKSESHILYALDKKGNRTNNSLSLSDDKIFSSLSSENSNSASKFVGGKDNKNDMMKTFRFLAKNNTAEWIISKYSSEGKIDFVLGTIHDNYLSPSSEKLGYSIDNLKGFIHAHTEITKEYEISSMGAWNKQGNDYSVSGDNLVKLNSLVSNQNYFYGTYFPESGNLYKVEGYKTPAFIKMVNNDYDLNVGPFSDK